MTRLFNLARNGVLALALAAPALAGCGQTLTPSAEAPPPAAPPAELAGAPPPPPAYAPPPPPAPAPEPPPVTMAPIPNPPETAPPPPRRTQAQRPAAPVAPRPAARPAPARPTVRRPPAPAAKPQIAQAAPRVVTPPPAKPAAPKPAAAALAPAKPAPAPAAVTPAKPAPAPAPAPSQTATPAAAPTAERVLELQKAAAKLVAQSAVLTPPAKLAANQAGEATLTIPADFAETLKSEAVKGGLGDAAASINLTARLTGDGYVISPDETQSAPLIAGAPTSFRWSVIPRTASPGPLQARLGADLLGGGGATLDLGDIRPPGSGGFTLTPRLIGLGLLVLIAAIVAIWATQRRREPVMGAPSSAERRAMRRAVRDGKPLDLHPKDV